MDQAKQISDAHNALTAAGVGHSIHLAERIIELDERCRRLETARRSDAVGEVERWLRYRAARMTVGPRNLSPPTASELRCQADKLAGSAMQNTCQHWAECGGGRLYEQIRDVLGCTPNDSTLQMIHQLKLAASATTEPHPDAGELADFADEIQAHAIHDKDAGRTADYERLIDVARGLRHIYPDSPIERRFIALGPIERCLLERLLGRLELGTARYGAMDLGDGRDWRAEASEEMLDATIYLAAALERQAGQEQAPELENEEKQP
jgi:hypothetical protein